MAAGPSAHKEASRHMLIETHDSYRPAVSPDNGLTQSPMPAWLARHRYQRNLSERVRFDPRCSAETDLAENDRRMARCAIMLLDPPAPCAVSAESHPDLIHGSS